MSSTKLRVKELLRERRWTTKVLAEKTGMSESYLTHIKNGTRRWNEDALRKLAEAFELEPTELFANRDSFNQQVERVQVYGENTEELTSNIKMRVVPIVGQIPSNPSPYNNQQMQVATGFTDQFVPVFNTDDEDAFCYQISEDSMSPRFVPGDQLVISPAIWTRSGDIVAVEYGLDGQIKCGIMQINYMDDFVVLESVNHRQPPIALVRGKDVLRVIGKVIWRYQRMK